MATIPSAATIRESGGLFERVASDPANTVVLRKHCPVFGSLRVVFATLSSFRRCIHVMADILALIVGWLSAEEVRHAVTKC